MRKRLSIKTRRPDLSRQEFRIHYENEHVPLGLTFIEKFRWRRYVRNYVISATGEPVHFDCYAEFWVDEDFDDLSLESFIGSRDFRALDEDDQRFLDVTQRLSFDVRERILKRSRSEDRRARKVVVVWKAGGEPAEDSGVVAQRIVDSFGDRVVGAVLDTPSEAIPLDAPFDTILTLRFCDEKPVVLDATVAPGDRWSVIAVDPIETPPDLLFFDHSDGDSL